MLLSSIRQHILDRAIRGQLVPQLPEEGTAEELYQQIQAEKQKLIAEGEIKNGTPLPAVEDTEIPFAIPNTWKWIRLHDICTIFSTGPFGSNLHKSDYTDTGFPVINPTNIQKNRISTIKVQRVNAATHKRLAPYKLHNNDILLARRGDLSKCAVVGAENEGWLCGTGAFFLHQLGIKPKLFLFFYISSYVQDYLIRDSIGTTMDNLNQRLLSFLPLPLPPLAEQERILQRVETLFAELDSIEESQKRISAIQTELTKRILEQAIQGKLVPQLPEEGTAEELYQQIQAEKKRLIAAGTIKKEKPLPPIEEKDLPFDIPETWKWVRLGDVCHILFSGKPPQYDKVNKHHPCLGQAANQIEGIRMSEAKYVTSAFFNTVPEYQKLRFGDVLLNTLGGGTIGRSGIFNIQDTDFITDGHIFVFRMFDLCTAQYLLAYLRHNLDSIIKGAEGSTNQTFLKKSEVLNYLFPLPPLAEQKRIVAKIEEMLTICKTLQ